MRRPSRPTLFPYTTLFRSLANDHLDVLVVDVDALQAIDLLDLVDEIGGEILDALDRQNVVRRRIALDDELTLLDRKSTRLNSSHLGISYAVFCLKKKKIKH